MTSETVPMTPLSDVTKAPPWMGESLDRFVERYPHLKWHLGQASYRDDSHSPRRLEIRVVGDDGVIFWIGGGWQEYHPNGEPAPRGTYLKDQPTS